MFVFIQGASAGGGGASAAAAANAAANAGAIVGIPGPVGEPGPQGDPGLRGKAFWPQSWLYNIDVLAGANWTFEILFSQNT